MNFTLECFMARRSNALNKTLHQLLKNTVGHPHDANFEATRWCSSSSSSFQNCETIFWERERLRWMRDWDFFLLKLGRKFSTKRSFMFTFFCIRNSGLCKHLRRHPGVRKNRNRRYFDFCSVRPWLISVYKKILAKTANIRNNFCSEEKAHEY